MLRTYIPIALALLLALLLILPYFGLNFQSTTTTVTPGTFNRTTNELDEKLLNNRAADERHSPGTNGQINKGTNGKSDSSLSDIEELLNK